MKTSLIKSLIFSTNIFVPTILFAQNTFPSNGNVGIGLSNPLTNLQIQAADTPYLLIRATTYTNNPATLQRRGGIIFNQENTDKTAGVVFAVPPGSHTPGILFTTKASYNSPGPGMKDWSDRMFIHPAGNVGVGTVARGSIYNLNQGSYPSYSAADRVVTIHSGASTSVLELSRDAGAVEGAKIGAVYFTNTQNQNDAHRQVAGFWAENVGSASYPVLSGGRMVWMTKAFNGGIQNKMIFDERGNLNIGTAAPNTQSYKLAVEGTIGARKVKVTQETWADFVFQPGYRLASLQEVEAYILRHRHLPDVPAEREVVKDGLDLGEMNKILLQKVEELTLHVIELNKRIQVLEKGSESK